LNEPLHKAGALALLRAVTPDHGDRGVERDE
jgi:hypothetical protein